MITRFEQLLKDFDGHALFLPSAVVYEIHYNNLKNHNSIRNSFSDIMKEASCFVRCGVHRKNNNLKTQLMHLFNIKIN